MDLLYSGDLGITLAALFCNASVGLFAMVNKRKHQAASVQVTFAMMLRTICVSVSVNRSQQMYLFTLGFFYELAKRVAYYTS